MFNTFRELAASLNLTYSRYGYHIGIKRDSDNHKIYRRVSDDVRVEIVIDGWDEYTGSWDHSHSDYDYLSWVFRSKDYESNNGIQDSTDREVPFICEYE